MTTNSHILWTSLKPNLAEALLRPECELLGIFHKPRLDRADFYRKTAIFVYVCTFIAPIVLSLLMRTSRQNQPFLILYSIYYTQ